MSNYGETILQAVDEVVRARLSDVNFDRTEQCTIVEVLDNNKYKVSNGTIKYEAFGLEGSHYQTGQRVYVTLPNGEYTKEKYINGAVSTIENQENFLINPLDKIAIVKEFYCSDFTTQPIKTNEGNGEEQEENIETVFPNELIFGQPDYFYINLKLNAILTGHRGSYTIIIRFYQGENIKQIIKIENSQLIGNPYNTNASFPYEFVIKKEFEEDIRVIDKITTQLIQDNSFENGGEKIHIDFNSYISLAYNREKITPNKIGFNIFDSNNNITTNKYYDSNNNIVSFEAAYFDDEYKYHTAGDAYWLQYVKGYTKTTENKDIEESGVFWKTIEHIKNNEDPLFLSNHQLTIGWPTDQYRLLVVTSRNSGAIEDYIVGGIEELNFTNLELRPEPGNENSPEETLIINFTEASESKDRHFNSYGTSGKYLEYSEIGKNRQLTFQYTDNTQYQESDSVEWYFPKNDTLLVLGDNKNIDKEINEDYYIIRNTNILNFKIATQYYSDYTNNKILCYAKDTYYGTITFSFGEKSTSGTIYSLNIYPTDQNYGFLWAVNDRKTKYFDFTLTDEHNTSIYDNIQSIQMKWSLITNKGEVELSGYSKEYGMPLFWSNNLEVGPNNLRNYGKYIILKLQINLPVGEDGKGDVVYKTITDHYPLPLNFDLTSISENTSNSNNSVINSVYDNSTISGSTKILYNYIGENPLYERIPYTITPLNDYFITAEELEWYLAIESQGDTPTLTKITKDNNSLSGPIIEYNDYSKKYYLTVPSSYQNFSTQADQHYLIVCQYKGGYSTAGPRLVIPLEIVQDVYANEYINAWDGMSTATGDSYVLSQMIGAGTKDSSNKFTGVLMGNVSNATKNNQILTGLYGFKDGTLSFSFDENGDAYLKGTIEAASGRVGNWDIGSNSISSTVEAEYDENTKIIANVSLVNYDGYWFNSDKERAADIMFVKLEKIDNTTNKAVTEYPYALHKDGTLICTKLIAERGQIIDCYINKIGSAKMTEANSISGLYDSLTYPNDKEYTDLGGITIFKRMMHSASSSKGISTTFSAWSDYWGTDSDHSPAKLPQILFSHMLIRIGNDRTINSSSAQIEIRSSSPLYDGQGRIYGTWQTDGTWTGTVASSTSSDRNLKNTFTPLTENYRQMYYNFNPLLFKYNNGTSNRLHPGFVAQEVEQSIQDAGLTGQDIALVVDTKDEQGNITKGLRYGEFVALNTWQIQEHEKKLSVIERELQEIKEKLI